MDDELYKILGVSKDATEAEIKKAYRDLSKEHHPDMGGNEEEFKKVAGAYEIVGYPDRRKEYDLHGTRKVFDVRQQKKVGIIQKIIDMKSDEYIANPLHKLKNIKMNLGVTREQLKTKMRKINADIERLRKNKHHGEMQTVLGMLDSVRANVSEGLNGIQMDFEICEGLIAEFRKACEILGREPDEAKVTTSWYMEGSA